MSDNAGKLFQARKFRGTVHGMITHLEAQMSKQEDKPKSRIATLWGFRPTWIGSFISTQTSTNVTSTSLNWWTTKTKQLWSGKQAVLDDYDDRMNGIMDHLIQLGYAKPLPTVVALLMRLEMVAEPSHFLHRRLDHMESTLKSANLTFESLTPGLTLDTCLMQQL